MTTCYMLDTDTCIEVIKSKNPAIRTQFNRFRPSVIAISAITLGELRFGAETSSQRDWAIAALAKLETKVRVAPLPAAAGAHYGQIRAKLEKAGHMIAENDLWLAAHARAEGWIFVTPNPNDFTLVGGLQIENWCELV